MLNFLNAFSVTLYNSASSSYGYTAGSCVSMLFHPFYSSAPTRSGFLGCSLDTLIINGSGGFRNSPFRCLHVSYRVEEFDNTARYHNHLDEASSINWLSIHTVQLLRQN